MSPKRIEHTEFMKSVPTHTTDEIANYLWDKGAFDLYRSMMAYAVERQQMLTYIERNSRELHIQTPTSDASH